MHTVLQGLSLKNPVNKIITNEQIHHKSTYLEALIALSVTIKTSIYQTIVLH